jgi:creatinine amidohydrolase
MDFPANSLPSAYCPEETFAILVRETLREVSAMGTDLTVVVNGHGAVNHNQVLHRLATEWNQTAKMRVHVRMAFPADDVSRGSIAHAGADETSILMNLHPATVHLQALPPADVRLNYADFAIVDSAGFDGTANEPVVPERDDPRVAASVARGKQLTAKVVAELIEEVGGLLANQQRTQLTDE